jgi:hypothetical protein
MIRDHVLKKITQDKDQNEEVVRLAYELAYEGSLKRPEQTSTDFIVERLSRLLELFEQHR